MTPAQSRYAAGLCARCGRTRETETQRCRRCTAKAAETEWKRRQTQVPAAPHGPAPSRHVKGWNFGTDALIVDHMSLAKAQAWRIAQSTGASVDVDDLVGDALYGLVVAGRTFDESYRVPFGAWATRQVKGAVYDGIRRWMKTGRDKPTFVTYEDVNG